LASDSPLTGEQIAALVAEVADELPSGERRHTIIVAGGSLLAWHGLRDTTVDVDSVERLDPELRAAVAEVAVRHDLAPRWLNDHAAMFRPQTLNESSCEVLLDHRRLLVLGASYRDVFLMKLSSRRALPIMTTWSVFGRFLRSPLRRLQQRRCTPPFQQRRTTRTCLSMSPISPAKVRGVRWPCCLRR
jgi:hypothetical protein